MLTASATASAKVTPASAYASTQRRIEKLLEGLREELETHAANAANASDDAWAYAATLSGVADRLLGVVGNITESNMGIVD